MCVRRRLSEARRYKRREGEVTGKVARTMGARVGVAGGNRPSKKPQGGRTRNTGSSLTILSGGGLLPTLHSSLPLECLTACCVASAVMMGGPGNKQNAQMK